MTSTGRRLLRSFSSLVPVVLFFSRLTQTLKGAERIGLLPLFSVESAGQSAEAALG
ncbi:MAG: hypothetical protein P8R54_29530 [Myxococcota bacterium]|nr:hypothetical protein [Myxococcota bacterium]